MMVAGNPRPPQGEGVVSQKQNISGNRSKVKSEKPYWVQGRVHLVWKCCKEIVGNSNPRYMVRSASGGTESGL
jgi:hypothetical protein